MIPSTPVSQVIGWWSNRRNSSRFRSGSLIFAASPELQHEYCDHIKDGQFKFEQNVPIPTREMTGLSVPTGVVREDCGKLLTTSNKLLTLLTNSNLNGKERVFRNWPVLASPYIKEDLDSGLLSEVLSPVYKWHLRATLTGSQWEEWFLFERGWRKRG